MKFKIIVLISLAILFGLSWQPAKIFILQDSCLDEGGKWASIGNYCIYSNCAVNKSCKPSYRNNEICNSLKLGISKEELYFHLGMPESFMNSEYTFSEGGGESKIEATIKNSKVVDLKCNKVNL